MRHVVDGVEMEMTQDEIDAYVALVASINGVLPTPSAADVDAERDKRINGGFRFDGVLYDSNADARENIAGAFSAALAYLTANGPEKASTEPQWCQAGIDFEWIAHDNTKAPMTALQMMNFGQAALGWKSSHIFAARTLKDLPAIPDDFKDAKYWPGGDAAI